MPAIDGFSLRVRAQRSTGMSMRLSLKLRARNVRCLLHVSKFHFKFLSKLSLNDQSVGLFDTEGCAQVTEDLFRRESLDSPPNKNLV